MNESKKAEEPTSFWQRPNILIALIGALASVVVALITTLGTISGSESRVNEISAKAETLKTSVAQISSPPGTIVAYGGPVDDAELQKLGWLPCDGRDVKRAEFRQLFDAIGTTWGRGDNVWTFNLPDLRGVFLRGVSGNRAGDYADPDAAARVGIMTGSNSGNEVGSFQKDDFKSHLHQMPRVVWDSGSRDGLTVQVGNTYGFSWVQQYPDTGPVGASETRPKNAYVHYIVKF